MTGFDQLAFSEAVLVLSLIALIGWELLRAIRSRAWVTVYSPTLFVGAVLAYYVLIGPLQDLAEGGVEYRGLDHRALLFWGWIGALAFFASLLLGFYFDPASKPPQRLILRSEPERLHQLGQRLCQLGLLMFGLVSGTRVFALLNPVGVSALVEGGFSQRGVDVGAVANYFNYAVNFLIPGLCLMTAAWLRQRRHTVVLILWLAASAAIYISLGFRYRLVLLAVPLLFMLFMARRRRPSLPVLALFLAGFITLNGLIGLTRSYGSGLDLAAVEDRSTGELFEAGFNEASVFYTTSGVIEQTPERYPFVGLAAFGGCGAVSHSQDAVSRQARCIVWQRCNRHSLRRRKFCSWLSLSLLRRVLPDCRLALTHRLQCTARLVAAPALELVSVAPERTLCSVCVPAHRHLSLCGDQPGLSPPGGDVVRIFCASPVLALRPYGSACSHFTSPTPLMQPMGESPRRWPI